VKTEVFIKRSSMQALLDEEPLLGEYKFEKEGSALENTYVYVKNN
jgi:hypothetical protein